MSEPRPRHPAARAFNLIVLVIGMVAFAFVARALGWEGMRSAIVGTGAWFAIIAAIDLAGSCCDAAAVHAFVRPHTPVRYGHVFAAQLGGIAINRLTPGNALGEPVKVTMLVRVDVPTDVAVSAIMMFNLTTLYVGIAAIVIGVPLTALLLDLSPDVARIVWLSLGAVVVLAATLALLIRRGALGIVIRALASLRVLGAQRATRWQRGVASIDARLQQIGSLRAPGLARALVGVLGSRVCNWLGTIAIMYAAEIPLTPPLVIASLSVGILVTWVSNVIPLGLGLADGTNYVLYGMLGASPTAGLLFTVVNRLRTIVLALMGLAIMTIANAVHRRGS